MKTTIITTVLLLFLALASACRKDSEITSPSGNSPFEPATVLAKTKPDFGMENIFRFIDSSGFFPKCIEGDVYTSGLPADSLSHVLDYLKKQPYFNADWPVYGYVNTQSQKITLFPRLYGMENSTYRRQWLETMQTLRLQPVNGHLLHLRVPGGTEQEQVAWLTALPFIEWASLNYIFTIQR